jgi:aspartate carbamoyltransferase catalytic subunit
VRGLLSIEDLSLGDIKHYLDLADRVEAVPADQKRLLLESKILGALFFEPSTRTRLSFEAAMARLGGRVIGFAEPSSSSISKGESFSDTVKTVEQYADILVIRHPREGAARLASERVSIPVINAGDGANQHPSQTLIDLYTIRKITGKLNSLVIGFVGDLRYSRTVPPLINVLRAFGNNTFILASPAGLRLSEIPKDDPDNVFTETTDLREAVVHSDILYVSRVQKERFADQLEYEKVKGSYVIDTALLASAKPTMRILHPLPRVNEIHWGVDGTSHAAYFDQMRHGVSIRQAILLDLLGVRL